MRIEDIKLKHFSNDVMAEVTARRQQILETQKKDHENVFAKKEMEYLTSAYNKIQDSLKKIDLEKSEMMSKTIMNNKMNLLHARTRLIDDVFDEVKKQLRAFTKTQGYVEHLEKLIDTGMNRVGEGDIVIIINASDKELLPQLIKKYKVDVELESEKLDMIGGCKVFNKTKQRIVDLSFTTKLEGQRDDFMFTCQLEVE